MTRAENAGSCSGPNGEANKERLETHGQSSTLEYGIWENMLGRCSDPGRAEYPRYGGRGITVCDRWRADFTAFISDVGPRPSPQHSIDRKDNDGNYEPGNVRWATAQQQARNRRGNRIISRNGEALTLQEWSERLGIGSSGLHRRIRLYGVERAFAMGGSAR